EVKALTEKCYSPNLKLISYDAHEENGVKKIKYYTHAPIDFDVIKDLTEKLHTKEFPVLYQDDNIENFCNTLDNINIAFKAKVTSGEIKKILDDEWAIAEKIILEINVKLNDHNKKNTASSILEEKIFDILEKLIKLSSPQASEEEINDKINSEQSLSDAYQCSNAADFINCLNAEIEKYKNASKYDATKDKNIEEIQSMLNDIKPFFDHPEKNENDKTKFESLKSTLEGSAYHLKQTPFHTILWSRIKTVSKNTAPEKIVTFANESGEDYFFKTQYTSAQEGWKKEAINCHGHAGPAGSLIDIDVYPYSESKQYNNLDKSDLGKTHRYFDAQKKRWEVDEKNTGDLIQQLSINIREPKSRADNSVASSFARFNYGATSSDTTQNSPTLPAPIPKQSL
ncbi:MAG: hypothetical protein NTU49_05215, partial [Gammaproteobacteria bacterium]|nr:hypothetical protein [Gammaproteobacteria bacterium]